ncbi:MAG: glycosyltransferase family 2 protein [Candidatus Moranbacteria bacterium]|nr:glycosyltransferase family 2 protein [Candidatus Moranbacteria bacterium]
MYKFPDPKTTVPEERKKQRFFEIIPGAMTWSTFFLMIVGSMYFPAVAAIAIIVFDIYFILKIIFITYYSVEAHFKMREGKKIDWWGRCQNIVHPEAYAQDLIAHIQLMRESLREISFFSFGQKRAVKKKIKQDVEFLREVEKLIPIKDEIWDWRSIVHVVFLPTANEPAEIIEPAIQSLMDANFPKSQMIVVLGTEERENPETRLAKVEYLQNKFKGVFRDFIVTTHVVAEGEMKCKASNATYAAKYLVNYLNERNVDFKKVIFSNFDCDSVAHPEYFAALTYAYITTPMRLQRAYQPIPVYHNTLWDTNAVVRMIVTGSSFWHLYQSTRREMVTFSSHSEPFDTLVKVGFWSVNIISEDSNIYWKCLSMYDGAYEVHPIHLPISLDAVLADTYWKTIVNQYKQNRRWAYGIENFPVTMRAIWPNKKIALKTKLRISFEMLEGHYTWATTAFVLAFLGWLPLALGGEIFRTSVLAHNLPMITQYLMQISLMGMLVSIPLSMLSLPPKPEKYHWTRYFNMLFQYLLFPVIAIFSAFPAIDSQTRIMTKNYFGDFWVTEKIRKQ